jgi:hypothetical protein
MVRGGRVLLLGAVAVGIVLALTSAPSLGAFGSQATGYGDSVVQPCPPGEDTAPDGGPCLQDLEVASGETAGEQGDSGGGGLDPWQWGAVGGGVLGLGAGLAYLLGWARPDFLSWLSRR